MGISEIFCFAKPNVVGELEKNERRLNAQAMKNEMKARQVGSKAKEALKRLEDAASRNDEDAAMQHGLEAETLERAERQMKNSAAGAKQKALELHIRGTQMQHLNTIAQVNRALSKSKVQGVLAEKIITDNKIFSEESKETTANLQAMMFDDNVDQDVKRRVQQAMHNHKVRVAEEARQQQQQLEEMMGPSPANARPAERVVTGT